MATAVTQRDVDPHTGDILAVMPKAELHLHLDGSLRLETIGVLAKQHGVPLPVPVDRISDCCVAGECNNLVQFLSYFTIPIQVLQTGDALERVVFELCEDVRRENVRYVEIRFAPALHTQRGLSHSEIIAAAVRGWESGRQSFGLAGGLILCSMRQHAPAETHEVARAGLPFLGHGVVGFDLAGDEEGFSVLLHQEPLIWARDAGYGMTVHAGEAAGPDSVRNAVDVIGVTRIGHGVRSTNDPSLLPILRDRSITLEMCPTSNVQTRAISSLHLHPLARLYRGGIRVTVNTDSRTVSATDMTHELRVSHDALDLTVSELADITLTAIDAGFDDESRRRAVIQQYRQEMLDLHILSNC